MMAGAASSSSFLLKLTRSKEVSNKREDLSYFSLPLFFFLRFSLNGIEKRVEKEGHGYYQLVAKKLKILTYDLLS